MNGRPRRIALLGAESTGKTRLGQALAEVLGERQGLRVRFVPELLRQWCEQQGRTPQPHEQADLDRANELCVQGDQLAYGGQVDEAINRYQEAAQLVPEYARAHRSLGALALNAQRRAMFREQLASFGLGLENRMGAAAGLLSGGQRQVLALIMATLNRPRILLLDEHTAALDPRTAQLVMDATRRLVAEHRLTTLMITHNMGHALQYGDRLVMLEAGRVKLDIGAEEKSRLDIPDLVRRFGEANDEILLQAAA